MKIKIGTELKVKKDNIYFGDCTGIVEKKVGSKFLIKIINPLGDNFFAQFTKKQIEKDFESNSV